MHVLFIAPRPFRGVAKKMKRLGDGDALDRLPKVDAPIAKAIRKTVEDEIRRMRWGEQGFRDVAYGQRIEPRYAIEDCRHAVAQFLENYMRDYVRELRSPRKDSKYLKTVPQPQQGD